MPRDNESAREARKRGLREAGDRSARIARELMAWKEAALAKLRVPDEVREEIHRARKITSNIARRRAERELAAVLRAIDLDEVEAYMIEIEAHESTDARNLHKAEAWRDRLIEEGSAAAEEFPGGYVDPLPQLIQNARRERDTGKPPGAKRALFRHVMTVLKAQPR